MDPQYADYSHIRVEHEQDLSWIVLNRPDHANALSNELFDEFSHALDALKTTGAPVLAIRGEGCGFSAGYDLGQVGTPKAADPVADRNRLQRNLDRYPSGAKELSFVPGNFIDAVPRCAGGGPTTSSRRPSWSTGCAVSRPASRSLRPTCCKSRSCRSTGR
jgi:hypothetical protein